MMLGKHLTPEMRRQMAEEIAESRRELEALAEQIESGLLEHFEAAVRPTVVALQRDLRAMVVQIWHRINSETSWHGEMQAPVKVDTLPPLLLAAFAEQLLGLGVKPIFEVTSSPIPAIHDNRFPDGTAIQLTVGREELPDLPPARHALALIPAERYLVLLGGWVTSHRVRGEEWPRVAHIQSKIGPTRANQWGRMQLASFIKQQLSTFHAAILDDLSARMAGS